MLSLRHKLLTIIAILALIATPARADETGMEQAGTTPDPHRATVQIVIPLDRDEIVGKITNCSGVYVAPGLVLTAKHCFDTSNYYPPRVYDSGTFNTKLERLVKADRVELHPSLDIALIFTPDTAHAWAPVSTTAVTPGTTVTTCGRNYVRARADYAAQGTNYCGTSTVATYDWWNPNNAKFYSAPVVIEFGDSGGPTYNPQGQVIGISSAEAQVAVPNRTTRYFNAIVQTRLATEWLGSRGVRIDGQGSDGTANTEPGPDPQPSAGLPAGMTRLSGANRVQTALTLFNQSPNKKYAVVTTGQNPADGLAATQLTGMVGAPVLLSMGGQSVDEAVMNALLNTPGLTKVYRVGGTANFSAEQESALQSRGVTVEHLVGSNRYETAALTAKKAASVLRANNLPIGQVYLADGNNYPDALAAGAAAGRNRGLLLLSAGSDIPAATAEVLNDPNYAPVSGQIIAVGGPAASAVANSQYQVDAVVGRDRFETSFLLAARQPGASSLVATSGTNFPDAIAGGAYAVSMNAHLVLVPTNSSYQGVLRNLQN